MRTNLSPGTKLALAMGLAASAIIFSGNRPVSAQGELTPITAETKADLRIGAFSPSNSRIRREVGNLLPAVGVDYYLGHNGNGGRNIVSIGYMDRGTTGHRLQMIPLTFGQTNYQYSRGSFGKAYFGYGVGAYFVNQDITDSLGFRETTHTTLFGGYVNVGTDLANNLFVDARYHFTSSAGSANPGGLELSGGFRF